MSSKESALDCTTARLECHCESSSSFPLPFHWPWFRVQRMEVVAVVWDEWWQCQIIPYGKLSRIFFTTHCHCTHLSKLIASRCCSVWSTTSQHRHGEDDAAAYTRTLIKEGRRRRWLHDGNVWSLISGHMVT